MSNRNIQTANWRGVIATNRRRTWFVVLSFILIYLFLGAFLQILFMTHEEDVTWIQAFVDVFTFKEYTLFLPIFFGISSMVVLLGVFFGGRLSLSGTQAIRIKSDTANKQYKQLYNVVEEMKIAASMNGMPKIYVLPVSYMNAFASGWKESRSVIAITQPLLDALTRDELQAVIAHELTHIRNQDTRLLIAVTLMANFAVLIIDILFRSVIYGGRSRNSKNGGGALILIIIILRILLPILTAVLILYLSRKREFMADAGGVKLTRNNQHLGNALIKIHQAHLNNKASFKQSYRKTPHEGMRSLAYFYDPRSCGIRNHLSVSELLSSHPGLEKRLKAIGYQKRITTEEVKKERDNDK